MNPSNNNLFYPNYTHLTIDPNTQNVLPKKSLKSCVNVQSYIPSIGNNTPSGTAKNSKPTVKIVRKASTSNPLDEKENNNSNIPLEISIIPKKIITIQKKTLGVEFFGYQTTRRNRKGNQEQYDIEPSSDPFPSTRSVKFWKQLDGDTTKQQDVVRYFQTIGSNRYVLDFQKEMIAPDILLHSFAPHVDKMLENDLYTHSTTIQLDNETYNAKYILGSMKSDLFPVELYGVYLYFFHQGDQTCFHRFFETRTQYLLDFIDADWTKKFHTMRDYKITHSITIVEQVRDYTITLFPKIFKLEK